MVSRINRSPGSSVSSGRVAEAIAKGVDGAVFERVGGKEMHVYTLPLKSDSAVAGALVIYYYATYIRHQLSQIWRGAFFRVLIQAVLVVVVTLLVVRWSIAGPIAQMAQWMKQLRAGDPSAVSTLPRESVFAPLAREASNLAKQFSAARRAAEEEARLRGSREAVWTPHRLQEHVQRKLRGKPLVLVSNREPYLHQRHGRGVKCIVPAGGVVTACEPVITACGGVWVAHGAGDADWETADARGRLEVPPECPSYVLRRVALTKEQESGYSSNAVPTPESRCSGTFRGPTPRPSGSAPGRRSCSTASSGPIWSVSTPSSSVITSSTQWTACSRAGSIGSASQ